MVEQQDRKGFAAGAAGRMPLGAPAAQRLVAIGRDAADEELMYRLADGQREALGPLYRRYAPLLFTLAAAKLDRAAAEEVIQDVFVAVWRHAERFDPAQGTFRPWVLQISRRQVSNALRRRRSRPQSHGGVDDGFIERLRDPDLGPAEQVARAERRAAVRTALAALPPPQRQALALAFFEELSHQEVAAALHLPLGTAKTRIRLGMHKLRHVLAPQQCER